MNKVDLLDEEVAQSLLSDASRSGSKTVYVSAVESTGLETLLARIDLMIEEDPVSRVHLRVPQKEGKLLALLEARSRVYWRQYKDGSVELEAEAPDSVLRRVREFVVREPKQSAVK
jgi:GTP-binding protein HflX